MTTLRAKIIEAFETGNLQPGASLADLKSLFADIDYSHSSFAFAIGELSRIGILGRAGTRRKFRYFLMPEHLRENKPIVRTSRMEAAEKREALRVVLTENPDQDNATVGKEWGFSPATIASLRRTWDLPSAPRPELHKQLSTLRIIAALFNPAATFEEVGRQCGVSKQRVEQVYLNAIGAGIPVPKFPPKIRIAEPIAEFREEPAIA